MFLINSPPHIIRCGPTLLWGRAYLEITPAILPSSLSISYLDCLGILYLPTCVWSGYGLLNHTFSGFSAPELWESFIRRILPDQAQFEIKSGFAYSLLPRQVGDHLAISTHHILGKISHIPMRHHITDSIGAGILTCNPSLTTFRCEVRSRLTLRRWTLRRNPWGFGMLDFHQQSLLMSAFLLLWSPPTFTCWLRPTKNTLLPPYTIKCKTFNFGIWLSPVTSSAHLRLSSELLRFL